MKPRPLSQGGQALVLIVLAAVGLFAFAALAIDGSAVFSDRRHSQNASDTAAYAAALARVRDPNPALGNWKQAGFDRAEGNGYDPADGVTEIQVHTCTEWKNLTGEECKGLPAAVLADPSKANEYIYVRIKSVVNLSFARIIGWQQVTNYTDAVVRAKPAEVTEWFSGMALVAANTTCPAPGDFGPFETGGSSNTLVTNSGVFVNANCNTSFVDNGGGSLTTADGVCLVGNFDNSPPVTGISPMPQAGCGEQIDITKYWMPDKDPGLLAPYCSSSGSISESGGEYIATPGRFGGGAFPDESPSGTLRLQKGIYCLDSGINLNAGWDITTDLDDDGVFDPSTEGVFFYVRNGDITFNGGMDLELFAMTDTAGGFPSSILRYLIYVPASNDANIELAGDGESTFTGMILAPTSNIDIKGNTLGLNLHTQIIALNTRISGNGTIDITYDPNDIPPAIKDANLSPIE
jgi:Flp pilus assembly protein TadG